MDSYRASLARQERSGSDVRGGDAPDDDDIGTEPPPTGVGQDERRMQVRAYNHWTSLLGARDLPQIEDLASTCVPDFAVNSVVLDFSDGIEDPAVIMLGERLADECGTEQVINRLSDVPGQSLLSRITDHYKQILTNQAPIGFEAEFVNLRNKTVVYRGILLPFSGDDGRIQHVMGVMNWKELVNPTVTAALIQELDDAAGAQQPLAGLLNPAPLGEWADGPAAAVPGAQGGVLPVGGRDEWDQTDWGVDDCGLTDCMAAARESAAAARALEDRAREALYSAISQAWDIALSAQDGLSLSDARVPPAGTRMTALVEQLFGAAYDKTRLADFATALTHAQRLGLMRGELANYLEETPGGLEGIVKQDRKLPRMAIRP